MEPLFISQREWAEALGVSRWTFRRWRAEGRIPIPCDLPGHPRWERTVADRVTRELLTTGQGRYFRAGQTRRKVTSLQSQASRFEQRKGALHGPLVPLQPVGDVHASTVDAGAKPDQFNSVEGQP